MKHWILLCLVVVLVAADDVKIEVLSKPTECSSLSASGDTLTVHYTGKLGETGRLFDSSLDRDTPIEVTLGAGRMIPGFEQGLGGMCIGEKRKITIPPELGYGNKGVPGVIPPGSTLVFTIELVALKKASLFDEVLPYLQTVAPFIAVVLIGYFVYTKVLQSPPAKSKKPKIIKQLVRKEK